MAHISREKVLAQRVQDTLVPGSEIVLLPRIMDLSSEVEEGMNQLTIPLASGLAVTDVPTDGSDSTGSDLATTGDTLNLDQHKEVHTYIKLKDWKQSAVRLETKFGLDAPKEMAVAFETKIATELSTSGYTNGDSEAHDFLSGVEDDFAIGNFITGKYLLDKAGVPKTERTAALDANGMSIVAAWSEFQDGSKSLSSEALRQGVVSQIKGFQVVQSENIAENKIVFFHKSAVAFAFQGEIDYEKEYKASQSRMYLAIKALYGCKKLDSGKRIAVCTQTNAV